jgi:signal transduction histidine kinase
MVNQSIGSLLHPKKNYIQRVLQEFMVNMKKYSQASFVVIGFDLVQNIKNKLLRQWDRFR